MGDEGGIMCHIQPSNVQPSNDANPIVTSITYVRVLAHMPFAPDIIAYQKHRVKKLRKLHSE